MTVDGSRIIDAALECSIVGSFSRVGYDVRSRLEKWTPVDSYNMSGKTVVITGPTSGLGRQVAFSLRTINANLVLVARNQAKLDVLVKELQLVTGNGNIDAVVADLGDLSAVRRAATQIANNHVAIHVLIHNAGALMSKRGTSVDGLEITVASHVVGPFVMTSMLIPQLQAGSARVITVSSGGMYAASLPHLRQGGSLELSEEKYDGSRQYAIAKRAQVTLNEIWAMKQPLLQFHAMHPGWADTPGVQDALPKFRNLTKPLLRSVKQGADTIVWLAVEPAVPVDSGAFWSDRATRSIHRLPTTKRSDTESSRDALWAWCNDFVDQTT